MWEEKLKKVQSICDSLGLMDITLAKPGAPSEVIDRWAEHVQKVLGTRPPEGYLKVLKAMNGFEWNGQILYGVDLCSFSVPPAYVGYGLIEQNEIWYEVETQKAYLFLGEGSISWYVLEIATGQYLELDNPTGREVDRFTDFDSLLERLLDNSLQ